MEGRVCTWPPLSRLIAAVAIHGLCVEGIFSGFNLVAAALCLSQKICVARLLSLASRWGGGRVCWLLSRYAVFGAVGPWIDWAGD
jgi:hypothetical protein